MIDGEYTEYTDYEVLLSWAEQCKPWDFSLPFRNAFDSIEMLHTWAKFYQ